MIMQSIFFGIITVWLVTVSFFPRAAGRSARQVFDRFMAGWRENHS